MVSSWRKSRSESFSNWSRTGNQLFMSMCSMFVFISLQFLGDPRKCFLGHCDNRSFSLASPALFRRIYNRSPFVQQLRLFFGFLNHLPQINRASFFRFEKVLAEEAKFFWIGAVIKHHVSHQHFFIPLDPTDSYETKLKWREHLIEVTCHFHLAIVPLATCVAHTLIIPPRLAA